MVVNVIVHKRFMQTTMQINRSASDKSPLRLGRPVCRSKCTYIIRTKITVDCTHITYQLGILRCNVHVGSQ